MIKFNILTLFPQLFTSHFEELPYKKAVERKKAEYTLYNLRGYALDKRGTVDDKPYGGGTGMILMIEPIYNALEDIFKHDKDNLNKFLKQRKNDKRIILLSPRGETYNQRKAEELSECSNLTFICGRYEGVDSRVEEYLCTDVISIGNYVVSGGELPALVIMESITRLIPGILEKEDASKNESFSNITNLNNNQYTVEYPQYTRPEIFMDMKVPKVLLSGNHKEIEKWRSGN